MNRRCYLIVPMNQGRVARAPVATIRGQMIGPATPISRGESAGGIRTNPVEPFYLCSTNPRSGKSAFRCGHRRTNVHVRRTSHRTIQPPAAVSGQGGCAVPSSPGSPFDKRPTSCPADGRLSLTVATPSSDGTAPQSADQSLFVRSTSGRYASGSRSTR